jgi:hypothetical protein
MAKNIAWAYYEKGLPHSASDTVLAAIGELKTLRGDGYSVEIYLAESYNLLALVYVRLGDSRQAGIAYQDSLGYALAVAESGACTAGEVHTAPDCLAAVRWVAEAREAVRAGEEDP